MKIYITGCIGFIGFNLSRSLLKNKKNKVIGIDKFSKDSNNDSEHKLNILTKYKNFKYFKIDISNYNKLDNIFSKYKADIVIHLAAEAGVRNSIINSKKFLKSNLTGFFNVIELVKNYKIRNFFYASSSSVYGDANEYPSNELSNTDCPLSFYGATKKSNEIIAYSYSKLFNINTIGLRFFTVYGPYGRVDMAIHKFFDKIIKGKSINLYNNGNHFRDFTFIDDVVHDIIKLIRLSTNNKPYYELYNIGGGSKINVIDLINKIEKITNKKAIISKKPLQKGDVISTHSDNKKISNLIKRKKYLNIEQGLKIYFEWYKTHYNSK